MGPLVSYELHLAHLIACTPTPPAHIARVCYCWLTKANFTKSFVHRHNQALCRCTPCVAELQPTWKPPSHMMGQTGLHSRSMQSRQMPVCCADNKCEQERQVFPRVVEAVSCSGFKGHRCVLRKWSLEQRTKLKTSHLFPWHGTYCVAHFKDVKKLSRNPLELNTKRSMGHFPFCIERHPQPAKTFCAAPNPLGTLRAHPAVKTLGITKHQICTQSLARNLQPCSWVFYRIFPTLTGDRAERRSQITCRGGSMKADARSFMGERGKG